jgi:hypothetical protein
MPDTTTPPPVAHLGHWRVSRSQHGSYLEIGYGALPGVVQVVLCAGKLIAQHPPANIPPAGAQTGREDFEAWRSTRKDPNDFIPAFEAFQAGRASAPVVAPVTDERKALAELLEAEEAKYPPAEAGQAAQTAWVERRYLARSNARALLAQQPSASPAQGDEALRQAMEAHAANGLAWAVSRWQAEVSQRPLVNVHRRTLDDTWRQVVRYFDGDPDKLLGASHDELRARLGETK